MKHLSEEEIVLHYYGDADDELQVRQHLAECSACRAEFERLQSLLGSVPPVEVPEPGSFFEEKMWLNIRDHLPEKPVPAKSFWAAAGRKWALAGVMAMLLVGAFLAGRFWPGHPPQLVKVNTPVANPQRIVLVAVGDHLERSQMLLVEIMNASDKSVLDQDTQLQARDLLNTNRLYRVSAQQAGDPRIAHLLDQLGRVLAEIANAPSQVSDNDLRDIRARIQSDGLLFKVRVVGSEVNSRMRRLEQNSPAAAQQRL
jgi:hypothetical protein